MARKVFISVLGTNNYIETIYEINGKRANPARFIQEALIKELYNDWTDSDQVIIFCTEKSKQMNWLDGGHESNDDNKSIGLSTILSNLKANGFKANIEHLIIDEGFNEKEIWSVFDKIYNQINDGDEIYLDITHAFRYLPMLALVLMNFSKVIKRSEVKAIHYGAFEKLGPAYEVRKMPITDRIAPVLNLSSFIDLQNWIEAANDFQKYGKTGNILNLTNENSSFESGLKALEGDLYTCRGKRLAKIEAVKKIRESLKAIRKNNPIPPKLSLIDRIEEKIYKFKQDDPINNILYSVDWCFMHGMIQQGITLAQESIITIILEQFDEYFKGYNLKDKDKRTLISNILAMSDEDFDNLNYKTNDDDIKLISYKILTNSKHLKEIKPPYSELTTLRNKINHGGFTDNSKYNDFEDEFFKHYTPIIEWCNKKGFINYTITNTSKPSSTYE